MPKRIHPRASIERVHELLTYDPDTGILRWRISRVGRGCVAGCEAGGVRPLGYRLITIDRAFYGAHVLAWVLMRGEWPDDEIDHIDLQRSNNIWSNLRLATRAQNARNRCGNVTSRTGFKGVFPCRNLKSWFAKIVVSGKRHYLGTFESREEAHAAYREAASLFHGEFARAA